MAANHYATLGVAPHSPREVVRAAYVRLMRRYHPDKNPSAEAAARVRAINAAYAVLSVAEERAKYDEMWRSRRTGPRPEPAAEWEWPHWNVMPAVTGAGAAIGAWVAERARTLRNVVPALVGAGAAFPARAAAPARPHRIARPALIAAGAAILAFVAYNVPAWVIPEKAIQQGSVGGKALASPSLPKPFAAAAASDTTLCSTEAAAQSITRELFSRAERIPGSNAAALGRIAASSLVRFASPAVRYDSQEGAVIGCRARIVLHLPPGVTAPGGRQSIDGIVAYSLRGAGAGGAAGLSLTAEPAIVKALAFLAQSSSEDVFDLPPSAVAEPLPTVVQPAIAPVPAIAPTTAKASSSAAPVRRPQPEPQAVQQKPSFACGAQMSWAEKSVCASANLAALDRAMSSLLSDAVGRANDSQRASLFNGDKRFVADRNMCSSEACVRHAYLANMSNIRAIMEGTPLPK